MFLVQKCLTGLLAGSCLVLGAGVWANSAIAQTADESFDRMGTDDDGAGALGDVNNPFEMIHRAISAPSISNEEFRQRQTQSINSEAQNFRLRQQEMIQQRPELTIEETEDITVDGESI